MARVLRGIVSTAAFGWISAFGLTVARLAPGDSPEWVSPILTLTLAIGATATLAAVILYAIPPVMDAWQFGVEYGRRGCELDRVPSQTRHLRPVR